MAYSCKTCKKQFLPKPSTKGIFCSLVCYHIDMKGKDLLIEGRKKLVGLSPWNKKPDIIKYCLKCGEKFIVKPSTIRINHCSKSCACKGRIPWNKGKKILIGEKHWNWKGGVSGEDKLERTKFFKYYQHKILFRDNYTCQVCRQYGGKLQVDHIKGWSEHPELRFSLDNCRTLCMACHYYVTFKRKIPTGIIWGQNFSRRIAS